MGVRARVVIDGAGAGAASEAARRVFDRLNDLDAIMSDYRPRSELNRLCSAPAGVPNAVSEDLFRVLERARHLSEATDGFFDITLGPLTQLWRRARESQTLPTNEELQSARARTGPGNISLDPLRRTATLAVPGMQLDLGGIAKGYAAHEGLGLLRAMGLPRCLVALAGDIAAGDSPPGEPGWKIDTEAGRRLTLRNACVSTSGGGAQSVEIAGMRYAHIIDPRTSLGAQSLRTVTVVGPDGATADALATSLSLADQDQQAGIMRRFPEYNVLIGG
jgi:thiamine biosynthesis lipoprotein